MSDGSEHGDSTNRRRFLKTTAALAGAGLAAGCTGGGGGTPTPRVETRIVREEGGTVVKTVKVTAEPTPGLETFTNQEGRKVGANIDAVKALAEQEGSMTVYATIDREPFQKWIEATLDAYPDVPLNISHITGSGEPLWARWNSEYQSGNVSASIFISGSNVKNTWTADPPHTMQLNADLMPSFGEIDDKFKDTNNNYWIAIRQILGHVHYNTNMVSQSDASSWTDIVTDSRWSGQNIGWDPTPNMFLMSWLLDTQGREFFENLRDQNP
ncbi:MAG: twin-arginine translocation signal domain-containing protein, partial [Halobacteriales archaeon]|nr:twin-arginine translocation signal domain-containing protein [Halobacteriales archaeon]